MAKNKNTPIILDDLTRARFWTHIKFTRRTKPTDCWPWIGSVNHYGHGHFKVGPRPMKAHRVSWTMKHGPIGDGLEIDHLCRNPRCVNPAHMELVSSRENTLRGVSIVAQQVRRARPRT